MLALIKDKLFLVLLALFALTLISWLALAYWNVAANIKGSMIIVIAFVKVRLIMVHYMELAKTYPVLRIAFELWIVLVATVTIALYLGAL